MVVTDDAPDKSGLLAAGADPKILTENGESTWEQQSPAVAKLLKETTGK